MAPRGPGSSRQTAIPASGTCTCSTPSSRTLNWENPEVFDDLEKTLRFWLERGIDGFRIDVAHGMAKPPGLPDMEVIKAEVLLADMDDDPRFNNDGVHEIHRQIRAVFNDYPDAVAIGEVWVYDNEQFSRYVRPDELHLGFNFRLLRAKFDATDIRGAIENSMTAAEMVDAIPTWTLANHDVDREPTRYGGGPIGLARARAMALVMLALPGAVFIYNGEELGLPNVDLPDEALRDPVWERSGHTRRGRDAVPGAGAMGGRRSPVRLLGQSRHLAAASAGMGGVDGARSSSTTPIRRCRSSAAQSNCGAADQNSAGPLSNGWTPPTTVWCSGSAADWCARSTRAAARWPCPRVRCCWRVAGWRTASCRRTPPPGWSSEEPARGRRGGEYTEPKRASMRSQAGSARTRTISSAATVPGPAARSPDCGRKPIAVKANTQRIGMPTLASPELTATTS